MPAAEPSLGGGVTVLDTVARRLTQTARRRYAAAAHSVSPLGESRRRAR